MLLFQSWDTLAELVRLVLNEYPKLRSTQGRKVLIMVNLPLLYVFTY